ncbi:uncharacterized protein SOCEGT47_072010 [Sorangium cellulosum]|jgi:hypothetical protein|uniref:Uncharacterized protein n=1 Tax=Sorangium cellulosum TaxID=56 RepID=A0A4P2QBC3_SORCE|nr:hypothetical protein [Sorangium cellulosum]AUX26631.1 uncharacterized protein SOCEGT47_072010 [Sorangium cellulosum]
MGDDQHRQDGGQQADASPPPQHADASSVDPVDRPDPIIELYKKHVDRSLLRENLKLTPEQRLLKMMDLQRFAAELQRAGRAAKKRP